MRPLVRVPGWRWVPASPSRTHPPVTLPCLRAARRAFVDVTFLADDGDGGSGASVLGADGAQTAAAGSGASGATPTGTAAYPQPQYVYPLDVSAASFKLYGEPDAPADGAVGRLFSSSTTHSYDRAMLYQELRAQESGAAATAVDTQALLKADEDDMDAVMREGRDKQGAASAAAVAAAVIEVSQTARVDGIAMVPNHPLPVVFPKQDGGVAARSFGLSSGPTASQLGQARRQARVDGEVSTDDGLITSEVMEGDGRIEGYSLHRVSTMHVTAADEQGRLLRIRRFKSFAEVPQLLPRLSEACRVCGVDCPTLLQSAALPFLLAGRDFFALSPHGGGRGLSYALPAVQVALAHKSAAAAPTVPGSAGDTDDAVVAPSVLVLCCTKQIVRQRGTILYNLTEATVVVEGGGRELPLLEGYTATGEHLQRAGSPRDVEVVIATVDYVVQQSQNGHLSLHRVRFLAVDGVADSDEYMTGLRTVVALVRRNTLSHQACVWGVKEGPALQEAVRLCLSPHHVRLIAVREVQATAQAKQILYMLAAKTERLSLLQRLFEQRTIQKRDQTLICCGYREVAETLAAFLTSSLSAPPSMVKCIHSGVREHRRLALLADFRRGDSRILVATNTVLRHADVTGVNHLVHFDLPASVRAYERRLHFLAPSGTVHVLLAPNDSKTPIIARYVEKITGHTLSGELLEAVRHVETSGGDNDWNLPSSLRTAAGTQRTSSHTAAKHGWRVRGKRHTVRSVEAAHEGGEDEADQTGPVS